LIFFLINGKKNPGENTGVIEVSVGTLLCKISFPLKAPGDFFVQPLPPKLPFHYTCLITKSFPWCWDKEKGGFLYLRQIPNLNFFENPNRGGK
jgi:hypothetical protein